MKRMILPAIIFAAMIGRITASAGVKDDDNRTDNCTSTDTTSKCKPYIVQAYDTVADGTVKIYDKTKQGAVKTYKKIADGTVKVYDKTKQGTVNTYDKVADGTANTYDKAKEGTVKAVDSIKKEFKKIF